MTKNNAADVMICKVISGLWELPCKKAIISTENGSKSQYKQLLSVSVQPNTTDDLIKNHHQRQPDRLIFLGIIISDLITGIMYFREFELKENIDGYANTYAIISIEKRPKKSI